MIRFVMAEDLPKYPRLQDSMFKDRADQFIRRLGWDVSVDGNGWERDQYDALNPLYVIIVRPVVGKKRIDPRCCPPVPSQIT